MQIRLILACAAASVGRCDRIKYLATDCTDYHGRFQSCSLELLKAISCLLFCSLICRSSEAQLIENITSFRTIDADRYIRVHYENDFFTNQDLYYSQGIAMEFVHPLFGHLPFHKILISGKSQVQLGIAAEHNGFTPTSTQSDSILYGDRPYAATLTMRLFSISRHDSLSSRITSVFSFGVIGPAAGGKAMQSTIHQWINDSQPLGWQHQIQNDVVLNYSIGIEKSLFNLPSSLLVTGYTNAYLGTLNTKLSSGFVLMAGKLNARMASTLHRGSGSSLTQNGITFHGYCQPQINLIAYDATLQGGVFNKSSPYTIAASDMERITLQANLGLVMRAGPVYFEYFYTFLTREFNGGLTHAWGGVRVGATW